MRTRLGDASDPVWDGTTLNTINLRGPETYAHEIGHFLVCPRFRRGLSNFGVGPDPYSGETDYQNSGPHWFEKSKMTPLLTDALHEEMLAGALGVALMIVLDGDYQCELLNSGMLRGVQHVVGPGWADNSRAVQHHVDRFVRWLTEVSCDLDG
jgi:hypothetical protein